MSNTSEPSEAMHVLIIGAGISGLLLAQGLKKNNIPFSIFDSEPSANAYRPREWTMSIHWSLPLLESLLPSSLFQKLESAQPDPGFKASSSDRMSMFNAKSGELLRELPTGGMRRFSRRKLRQICSTSIDVAYGKALAQISYSENGTSVTAYFSDGTQATGTTLIGTDGPRSKTRELLLGSDLSNVKPSGFILLSATMSFTASLSTQIRSMAGMFVTGFHPNSSYYVLFPQDLSSTNAEEWTWQLMHSSVPRALLDGTPAERLSYLKAEAQSSEVMEPFRSVIEQIPEGTMVFCDELVCWEPVPFDSHQGRATLAGDAAHPMTPQRGQGLNHAICDLGNLVRELCEVRDGAKGLEEAIESYGAEMVDRGSEEVKAALLNHKADCMMKEYPDGPRLEQTDGESIDDTEHHTGEIILTGSTSILHHPRLQEGVAEF